MHVDLVTGEPVEVDEKTGLSLSRALRPEPRSCIKQRFP